MVRSNPLGLERFHQISITCLKGSFGLILKLYNLPFKKTHAAQVFDIVWVINVVRIYTFLQIINSQRLLCLGMKRLGLSFGRLDQQLWCHRSGCWISLRRCNCLILFDSLCWPGSFGSFDLFKCFKWWKNSSNAQLLTLNLLIHFNSSGLMDHQLDYKLNSLHLHFYFLFDDRRSPEAKQLKRSRLEGLIATAFLLIDGEFDPFLFESVQHLGQVIRFEIMFECFFASVAREIVF